MAEKQEQRRSPVSRWGQIARELGRRIEQRELLPGDQLPSENELAEMFDVSRLTMRQALSALADDGYVHRRHGSGTFVSDALQVVQHDLAIAQPWRDRLGAAGVQARSAELPGSRQLTPPATLLNDVGVQPEEVGDRCFRRLQLIDDRPIGLSESWLAPGVAVGIEEQPLDDGSLSKTLTARYGIDPEEGHSYVHAETASAEVAELLQCNLDTPLIVVSELSRDQNGKIIHCSRTRWIGYRVRFHQIHNQR